MEAAQKMVRQSAIVMEEVTDPGELNKARVQDERFERNFAWFQAHAKEIFAQNRGKYIGIAGQRLFIADTPDEIFAETKRAYPEDDGRFIHYIPKEKLARIYAN